jgi:hypothetical protein
MFGKQEENPVNWDKVREMRVDSPVKKVEQVIVRSDSMTEARVKLIPGGEIRMIKKGDVSTFKGEAKSAKKDLVVIKLTSQKSPMFIDGQVFGIMRGLMDDKSMKALYADWFI